MMRQSIAMSKQKVTRTNFNFDEWVDAVPKKKRINKNAFNENQIRLTVKKHKKKENMYHVTFSFREKILNLIDNSDKPKIIFFKHKDDDSRILLTKSENGYAIANPSKSDYYFFKSVMYSDKGINEGVYNIDPIFHVKGKNSGSIVEIKVKND